MLVAGYPRFCSAFASAIDHIDNRIASRVNAITQTVDASLGRVNASVQMVQTAIDSSIRSIRPIVDQVTPFASVARAFTPESKRDTSNTLPQQPVQSIVERLTGVSGTTILAGLLTGLAVASCYSDTDTKLESTASLSKRRKHAVRENMPVFLLTAADQVLYPPKETQSPFRAFGDSARTFHTLMDYVCGTEHRPNMMKAKTSGAENADLSNIPDIKDNFVQGDTLPSTIAETKKCSTCGDSARVLGECSTCLATKKSRVTFDESNNIYCGDQIRPPTTPIGLKDGDSLPLIPTDNFPSTEPTGNPNKLYQFFRENFFIVERTLVSLIDLSGPTTLTCYKYQHGTSVMWLVKTCSGEYGPVMQPPSQYQCNNRCSACGVWETTNNIFGSICKFKSPSRCFMRDFTPNKAEDYVAEPFRNCSDSEKYKKLGAVGLATAAAAFIVYSSLPESQRTCRCGAKYHGNFPTCKTCSIKPEVLELAKLGMANNVSTAQQLEAAYDHVVLSNGVPTVITVQCSVCQDLYCRDSHFLELVFRAVFGLAFGYLGTKLIQSFESVRHPHCGECGRETTPQLTNILNAPEILETMRHGTELVVCHERVQLEGFFSKKKDKHKQSKRSVAIATQAYDPKEADPFDVDYKQSAWSSIGDWYASEAIPKGIPVVMGNVMYKWGSPQMMDALNRLRLGSQRGDNQHAGISMIQAHYDANGQLVPIRLEPLGIDVAASASGGTLRNIFGPKNTITDEDSTQTVKSMDVLKSGAKAFTISLPPKFDSEPEFNPFETKQPEKKRPPMPSTPPPTIVCLRCGNERKDVKNVLCLKCQIERNDGPTPAESIPAHAPKLSKPVEKMKPCKHNYMPDVCPHCARIKKHNEERNKKLKTIGFTFHEAVKFSRCKTGVYTDLNILDAFIENQLVLVVSDVEKPAPQPKVESKRATKGPLNFRQAEIPTFIPRPESINSASPKMNIANIDAVGQLFAPTAESMSNRSTCYAVCLGKPCYTEKGWNPKILVVRKHGLVDVTGRPTLKFGRGLQHVTELAKLTDTPHGAWIPDGDHDFAYYLAPENMDVVKHSFIEPTINDALALLLFDQNNNLSLTQNFCTGKSDKAYFHELGITIAPIYNHKATTVPGDSGAPVCNAQGECLGSHAGSPGGKFTNINSAVWERLILAHIQTAQRMTGKN